MGGSANLHAVGGRGLAELARLPHDPVILGVGRLETGALALARGVGGGAEVFHAGLLGEFVEQAGCHRGGCGEQGRGEDSDTHVRQSQGGLGTKGRLRRVKIELPQEEEDAI